MARVLIADDEPNIVLSLEFILRAEGHEVHVARDGDEALRCARTVAPDLLLLDVMMPARNGYEICRALRADPGLGEMRILMLTARGAEADRDKGLALGADAYVTKPFSTRELLATVRGMLAGGAVRAQ